MKKLLSLFLAILMIFSCFALSVSAETDKAEEVFVFEVPTDKVDMTKKKRQKMFI